MSGLRDEQSPGADLPPAAVGRAVPDLLFTIDREGRICDFHAPPQRKLLMPPEQFLGKRPEDFLPPATARILQQGLQQALAAGPPPGIVFPLSVPDGERWYEAFVVPPGQPGADARRLQVILCDITESRRAAAALAESEARHRALFENLRDAFVRVDMAGRLQEFNHEYELLTGYSTAELSRLTYQELTPERWQGFEARIIAEQVLVRGFSDLYQKEYRRKDGTLVPIELRTILVRDAAGAPAGMWAIIRDISAAQRAAAELRASETKYRQLFETIRDALARSDLQGRIVETNAAFQALTGYSAEELVGKTHQDLVVPEDQAQIPQSVAAQLLPRGYTDLFSARILRKDGTAVPVEIQSHLIRDTAGQPTGVWATLRDITARKRAEEDVSRNRDLLDATQRLARVGGWEWDVAGQTMTWTEETYRVHGMTANGISAGSPEHVERSLACYDPEDRPVIAEAFRRCAAEGHTYDLELPLTRVDGRRIWIRTQAHAVKDGDSIVKVVGTIMDITERKRAENFLCLVLDLIPTAVFWKDRDSVFLGCNQTVARAAGLASPEQIVGKTDHDLGWNQEEADYYVAMDRWVMENDEPEMHIIEPQLQADGRQAWLDTCKIPLHDEEGRVIGILGAFLDITEHRTLEKALRDLAGELEHRVRERTAELEASRQALALSEERFRQMAEHSQEVIWLIDAKTRKILYASPAFERIWNQPAPAPGSDVTIWLDTIHPDDRERVVQDFTRGMAAGQIPPLEYRILRPDGSQAWIEVSSGVIRGVDGTVERLVGVSRNITERHRLEAEILHTGEAERQRIGQDLHDSLCQTLTAIGYQTEALRQRLAREKRPEAAEVKKLAQMMAKTLEQSRALAQGLLLTDLARGGLIPGLQSLARSIQELFGVACVYAGPAELALPNADTASQFYRIAQEAATNAAKHGRGRRIVIQLENQCDGVQLSVRDDGLGLPEPPGNSNGLGLDIMRYRAGMIGATLTIKSTPGKGTTVTCVAPRAGPETPAAQV